MHRQTQPHHYSTCYIKPYPDLDQQLLPNLITLSRASEDKHQSVLVNFVKFTTSYLPSKPLLPSDLCQLTRYGAVCHLCLLLRLVWVTPLPQPPTAEVPCRPRSVVFMLVGCS